MTSVVIRDSVLSDYADNNMNAISSNNFRYKDDDDDAQIAASSSARQKHRQEAIKRFKPGTFSPNFLLL